MEFPDKDMATLEVQALAGEKAKQVSLGEDWKWVKEKILGALEDQAIHTLMNAKTEEDRMKAQQMFLASKKPQDLITFLISQGDAAVASLKELASQDVNPTLNQQEDKYA